MTYIEKAGVKYTPIVLKSFEFKEYKYYEAALDQYVYDTKIFYYEEGMTWEEFVNSKYNVDNYFTFIPEYEYMTLSKTE